MRRLVLVFLAAALAAPAAAAERLVVQLNGEWAAEHAGFAVARADGLYAAEGLDVAFRPGRSIEPLIRGEVDLAVEQLAPGLLARERGGDAVNIAQILRKPAARIVCGREAQVRAPADLRGPSFQPPPASGEPAFDLALAALGIVRPRFAAEAPCRLDRGFAPPPDGAFALALADMELELLEEGVWALDFQLRDAAFAARATRFLRASLDGWSRFIRDPKGSLAQVEPGLRERLAAGAAGAAAAVGPGELGRMDEAGYLTTVRLLMLGWTANSLTLPPQGAWRDDLRAAARPARPSAAPVRGRGK